METSRNIHLWLFVGGSILFVLLSITAFGLTSGGWTLVQLFVAGGLFMFVFSLFLLIKGVGVYLKGQRNVTVDVTLAKRILLVLLGALLLNSADCGDFECSREVGTLFIQRLFHLSPFLAPIQSIAAFAGLLLMIAFAGLITRLARRAFKPQN